MNVVAIASMKRPRGPRTRRTGAINVSLPLAPEIHRAITELAVEHERSLAAEITYVVKQYIKAQQVDA